MLCLVCAVLVGDESAERYNEDVKNINHWYFWDPMRLSENDGRIYPGDMNLRDNAWITQNIETLGYRQFHLVNFEFPDNDGNITSELQYGIEERMSPTNPNKPETEPPQINASNIKVPFVYAKADSTHVNENPATASDNEDLNPSLAYDWSSNQTSTGILTDVNYDISVTATATDRTGNSAQKDYSIFVRDKVAPTGNFSTSQVYGDEGENPTEIAKGLVENVADNSRLPVDKTFISTLTTDNVYESIYSVSAELKDIAGNKKNIGNLEIILIKADTEAPIISTEDKKIPYVEGKSIEAYVNENQASVTDNMDTNPIVNYNWTDDKEGDEDKEFDIFVEVTATDESENSDVASYTISVWYDPTSIDWISSVFSSTYLAVYPIPVSGIARVVYYSSISGVATFRVYESLGKRVSWFSDECTFGKNTLEHDFTAYESGFYVMIRTNGSGQPDKVSFTVQ